MLWSFARTSAATWRISAIVSTNCILEAVVGIRIVDASNIARPVSQRITYVFGHLGVALQKLRLERVVEAEDVGKNEHLSVAERASPDADCRNADRRRDSLGNRCGYKLEHNRERPCLLQPFRFANQSFRPLFLAALNPRSADGVDGLRREADVSHD